MSPEQLRASDVDERSDLFSFAICVYYALTARLPFEASSLIEMAAALSFRCPSVLEHCPQLPRALDRWFVQALARDPSERFETVADACGAFADAIEPKLNDRRTPLTVEVDVGDVVAAGVPKRHGTARWLGAATALGIVAWTATHEVHARAAAWRAVSMLPATAADTPLEAADVRRHDPPVDVVAQRLPLLEVSAAHRPSSPSPHLGVVKPSKMARAVVAKVHAASARAAESTDEHAEVDAGADALPLPGPFEDEGTRGFGGRE